MYCTAIHSAFLFDRLSRMTIILYVHYTTISATYIDSGFEIRMAE